MRKPYTITMVEAHAEAFLNDAVTLNPFPMTYRDGTDNIVKITLNLLEEELTFLKLRHQLINVHEITAVDVVGAIINA